MDKFFAPLDLSLEPVKSRKTKRKLRKTGKKTPKISCYVLGGMKSFGFFCKKRKCLQYFKNTCLKIKGRTR